MLFMMVYTTFVICVDTSHQQSFISRLTKRFTEISVAVSHLSVRWRAQGDNNNVMIYLENVLSIKLGVSDVL